MTDARVSESLIEAVGTAAPSATASEVYVAVLGVPASTTATLAAGVVEVLGVKQTRHLVKGAGGAPLWIKVAGAWREVRATV